MALLGTLIESHTTTSIVSQGSRTFAHGLPADPDIVLTEAIASIASSTNWWHHYVLHDTANCTVHNCGGANGPSYRVVAVVFHSIIR